MKSYIECLNCKAIEDSNFTSELIAQDWIGKVVTFTLKVLDINKGKTLMTKKISKTSSLYIIDLKLSRILFIILCNSLK